MQFTSHLPNPIQISRLEMIWTSEMAAFSEFRQEVEAFLLQHLFSSSLGRDILLAIDESITNAVQHSTGVNSEGTVKLVIWLEQFTKELARMTIEISDRGDFGRDFSPIEELLDSFCQQQYDGSTGFGLRLLHRLMDEIDFRVTEEGEKCLTMRKWFCNSTATPQYFVALLHELQKALPFPTIEEAKISNLLAKYPTSEVGDLLIRVASLLKIDPDRVRRALVKARLNVSVLSES